jgi:Ser-tRNA(Ala) deacylase AlaX
VRRGLSRLWRAGHRRRYGPAEGAHGLRVRDHAQGTGGGRTKINLLPEGIRQVRVVEIVGLDLQADGGTHVRNTSEVGRIRVADYKSKGKINKRIYIELEP